RDFAGRLVRKTLPDGKSVDYAYDRQGNLLSVDDSHWFLAYEYDQQNRLTAEHQGWGTLRYGYDACGQLQKLRLPDNNRLVFNHSKGGHLATVELNGEVLTSHLFKSGQEHQRQQGALLSHYHYDDQQRLHAHAVTQQNHYLYQRQYDYDKSSNLTRLLDTRKGEHHYHYDPLNRLTRADHSQDLQERFGHDPAGNLLMQDLPGPDIVAGNRLLMQGDYHYDYDAFGNLIRERRGKGHQLVTEYRYDCQHRLVEVKKTNGQTASYRYDPFGRRISKTVDNITTEFFWQGDKLIAEHHKDKHRSFIYEPDSFRPLVMLEGYGPKDTKPYHYQLDHLGTPQELTTPEGEVVWSAHYRAYGEISRLDIGKVDNPLRFQGQYFDQESRLHYNRHRYYNPDIGRYLTPDPVKLAGGINAFEYAPNPTGWVDPLGLSTCPGGPDCKPSATAPHPVVGVDHGEPELPQLTRAQRQARIDHLAEANVHRRLTELEASTPRAHFLEKHGAQTSLESQFERVETAKNPTTGEIERYLSGPNVGEPRPPSAATHFLSHRDQLNAIYRAQLIFKRVNLSASRNPMDMGKIVAEGYKREGYEYGKTSKARVFLNEDGQPITAYGDFQ
ncbi:RHS repeat domain-containing protein, partial [Pseudomonas syringae]|uniref:RHS repeat domain-containing protein n=1 Tax=Pseudomonas syringae TaxID=317 RepID=UPI001F1DF0E3